MGAEDSGKRWCEMTAGRKAVAAGSSSFVATVRKELGARAGQPEPTETDGMFTLRDSEESYRRETATHFLAVTKRGRVEALIVPSDAGERLANQPDGDNARVAWQMLIDQLLNESKKKRRSAVKDAVRRAPEAKQPYGVVFLAAKMTR
jgi:hypothetical protein